MQNLFYTLILHGELWGTLGVTSGLEGPHCSKLQGVWAGSPPQVAQLCEFWRFQFMLMLYRGKATIRGIHLVQNQIHFFRLFR
jgi:hypothetical protein